MDLYGHALCSTLTASSLAATLITIICVVLTLKVNALKEANVGWISAVVLLVVVLLIPTIIIWRQPQSNARLNFKVSAASGSLLSPSLWTRGWCRICQGLLLGFHHPEMPRAWSHSSVRRSPWSGSTQVAEHLQPQLGPSGTADVAPLVPCRYLSSRSCRSSASSLTSC